MSTEIELKYLVEGIEVAKKFTQLLEQQNLSYIHKTRHLSNTYFDTQDRQLRKLDFGLRVRKADDYTEQTIKTAGTIIGGLHQRPEYNVDIVGSSPDLSLFPLDIWPEHISVEALQAELLSIFSTNFTRESWQITFNGSEIEVAFDQGAIESQGNQLPICEIEIELISGKRQAVLDFAQLLFEIFNLAAGQQSKAARGYQLWRLSEEDNTQGYYQVPQINLSPELSVERALVIGMEQGLKALQGAIANTLADTTLVNLKLVYEALAFIQHGLNLYHPLIEESLYEQVSALVKETIDSLSWLENAIHINDLTVKTGRYRKKVEYSNQLISTLKLERSRFPNEQEIKLLITGKAINKLQLSLLQFILSPMVKPAETPRKLKDFAYKELDKRLDDLSSVISSKQQLAPLEYLVMQHHLYGSLLTGNWFTGLFEQQRRQEYRRTWLDVFLGIEELAVLVLLQNQLNDLEDCPKKLANWLDGKVENLITAINHSYQSALKVEPYWR